MATTIVWTVRNLFFIAGYSARVMGLRWWASGPSLAAGAIGTLAVGLGGYGLTQIWWPVSWLGLGGMAIAISVGYGIAVYLVGLNQGDRLLLSGMVYEPIRRYLRR